MDWTMLGAVGELLGALAVVLSLLYVGRQVKQSNTMARSAVWQEITSEINHWAMTVAAHPELAATMAKAHFEGLERDQATDLERIQMAYVFVGFLGQLNLAHTQTEEGILTPEELNELYGPGSALLQLPYLKQLWPILRPSYSAEFRQWFETRYSIEA